MEREPQRETTPGYYPLVIVLAAAAAGMVADRYRPLPVAAWWAMAAVGLCLWFPLWRRQQSRAASLSLLFAAAALAVSWHHCCWNLFRDDDLGLFARTRQQPVYIEAVALQTPRLVPPPQLNPLEPPRSGEEVRFEVELRAIRNGDRWQPVSGRAALVVEGLLPDLAAGDCFRAFAHLLPPEHALNPGEIDRANRDRARRVTSHLRANFPEAIALVSRGLGVTPRRLLEGLRRRGQDVFARRLWPQQANLAAAVLLGLRDQLDPEETEAFQLTGTIHLLVIAGLHLGILAGLAGIVLRRALPWRWGLPATALFTVLYMLLVDAQPPVVRATVLIVATCGAAYVGRRRIGLNVLALAGVIVLVLNPVDLFNVGPQLSFLCVAGLMVMVPGWWTIAPGADRPQVADRGPTRFLPVRLRRWLLPEPQPAAIRKLLEQEQPFAVRVLWLVGRGIRRLTLVSGASGC